MHYASALVTFTALSALLWLSTLAIMPFEKPAAPAPAPYQTASASIQLAASPYAR